VAKVAIVTGASQGIGLATATAFAEHGYVVVATSRIPQEPSGPVGTGRIERVALDVTDDEAVTSFVGDTLDRHGHVDVLVNNAGQGFIGSTEELSVADIRRSMEVNFFGVVRMTKALLPSMRVAGRGRLIAVGSIGGVVGQPFNDAYCAAKFAVEGLYESLHPVAAASGVAVIIVEPGPVQSDHRNRAVTTDGSAALASMRDRYVAMTEATFERAQAPERSAEIILAAAEDPAPKLRYQTSRLVTHIVGLKLRDLDGDAITGLTKGWIAEAEVGAD
jgi:NAD(P)-dependent dehydrogenase (short-subunit alcohol dehydrogenase family)